MSPWIVLKKYETKIDYWISGKDKGIYDAMNNGIDLANGIECVLNAANYDKLCLNTRRKITNKESLIKKIVRDFGKIFAARSGEHSANLLFDVVNPVRSLKRLFNVN